MAKKRKSSYLAKKIANKGLARGELARLKKATIELEDILTTLSELKCCYTCKFNANGIGTDVSTLHARFIRCACCMRYPLWYSFSQLHWCGEYRAKRKKG